MTFGVVFNPSFELPNSAVGLDGKTGKNERHRLTPGPG